jgi:phosphinothricin acetyltransferase
MISFRSAELLDLPLVVEIYNSTIPSGMVTADLVPVTVDSRLNWFNEHNSDTRPLWMVAWLGEIAGWVSFQSFYKRPAYRHTSEISIYLHSDFRGKGIGRSILSYCFENCPKLQIKTLLGFIFAHNLPSLNLFVNAGFEEWGMLPNIAELHGVERSLKILGKHISQ